MAQVAQAYFHFQTRLSAAELRRFGRQVDKASRQAAIHNFDNAVLITVELEEGSLIGRVTARLAVLAIFTGLISDYKGVKDSVKEMYSDARSFGSEVVQRAVDLAGVSDRQVYRVERRTKTLGKLDRLLGDVERLQHSTNDLSPSQMKEELGRLQHQLELISKDLQPNEQAGLLHVLGQTKLPAPAKWPRLEFPPHAVMRPDQLELEYEAAPAIEDQSRRSREPHLRYQSSFKVEPRRRARSAESLLIPKDR